MAPSDNPPSGDTDLAQAFKDLAKGERTASAMEHQLTSLEHKIDELLASVDNQSANVSFGASASHRGSGQGPREGEQIKQ